MLAAKAVEVDDTFPVTALMGGRVFMPDKTLQESAVLISGETILAIVADAEVPTAAVRIDCNGQVVLPGLIDMHFHLTIPPRRPPTDPLEVPLRAYRQSLRTLRAGTTTVRNLGGIRHLETLMRRAIEDEILPGPTILTSGEFLRITGGHGQPDGREVNGAEEMRRAVREQLFAGADWIKLMCSGGFDSVHENPQRPEFSSEEIRIAVEEAARVGKYVAAHAHGEDAIRLAVEAGVRSIEHGSFLDEECAELMAESEAFLVPTFAIYDAVADKPGHPMREQCRRIMESKLASFEIAYRGGVAWAVGSDGGYGSPIELLLDEIIILVRQVGLAAEDVLWQASQGNARLLGLESIGSLEPGNRADVIVVEGNPLDRIEDIVRISRTFCNGRHYDWSALAEPLGLWTPSEAAEFGLRKSGNTPSRFWPHAFS